MTNFTNPITVSAADLCSALWGQPLAYVNAGCYEGTKVRVRQVPADAVLTVTPSACGKGTSASVSDSDGGWIADRFGSLGARDLRRVVAYLASK